MTDFEDTAVDAFTTTGECWAWKKAPSVIGGQQHTHICRELVDDENGTHDGKHHCTKCGTDF